MFINVPDSYLSDITNYHRIFNLFESVTIRSFVIISFSLQFYLGRDCLSFITVQKYSNMFCFVLICLFALTGDGVKSLFAVLLKRDTDNLSYIFLSDNNNVAIGKIKLNKVQIYSRAEQIILRLVKTTFKPETI